jgi:uncharacterized protein YkwD
MYIKWMSITAAVLMALLAVSSATEPIRVKFARGNKLASVGKPVQRNGTMLRGERVQGTCKSAADCAPNKCCSKWGNCGVGAGFCTASSDKDDFQTAELSAMNVHRQRHCDDPAQLADYLNNYAQSYAQQLADDSCAFQHSGGPYGECLYMSSGTVNGGDATEDWYSEISQYDFDNPGFNPATGHFTQVVWKASLNFGVGYATCDNGMTVVVGSYDPPGNVIGEFAENVLRPTC